MDKKELQIILEKHKKWLKKEKGGERADLSETDLRHANLIGADLSEAYLRRADLSGADLYGANLYNANLHGANLYGAELSETDLRHADLSNAKLVSSKLECADLWSADLSGADLRHSDLKDADLRHADLDDAKLNAKDKIRKGIILSKKIFGYKICKDNTFIKLEIPKGAVVFSINNAKCRTNKAKVLKISNNKKIAYSNYDNSFIYKIGNQYEVKDFDLRYNIECGTGIHFFKTLKEAKKYQLYTISLMEYLKKENKNK